MTDPLERLSSIDPSDSMEDALKAVVELLDHIEDKEIDKDRALALIAEKEAKARDYYLRPFDSDDIYNRLVDIHTKRDEQDLVNRYRRCLDLKQARKWMILGDCYQLIGLNTRAAKFLKRSLFFGPAEDLVDAVERTLEKAEKRISKANDGLQKTLLKFETDPGDQKNSLKAATFLLDLDRLDEAMNVADVTMKTHKDDPDLLYRKGIAMFGLDDMDSARAIFESLLSINPNSNNYKRAYNFSMEMGNHS